MTGSRESHIGDGPSSSADDFGEPMSKGVRGDAQAEDVVENLIFNSPDVTGQLTMFYPEARSDWNPLEHFDLILSEDGPYSTILRKSFTRKGISKTEMGYFIGDFSRITSLLGVDKIKEMMSSVDTGAKRDRIVGRVNKRALRTFSTSYERAQADTREEKIVEYARIANAFITTTLGSGVWEPLSDKTDMKDEVLTTSSIPGLLDLMFNDPDRRIRFEAKRKLALMDLAATVDARREEIRERDKYPKFIELLANEFWATELAPNGKPRPKTGGANTLIRLSYDNFASIGDPQEYSDNEISAMRHRVENHKPRFGGYYLRTRYWPHRYIEYKGKLIAVSQDTREKELYDRIGKMVRKQEEDPSVAVQDNTGLKLVARNERDARLLFKYFARGGKNGSLPIKITDIEDTLDGKSQYSAENEGSSPLTRQLKFIATVEGISVEVQIHTYETYINSEVQDMVAHEEYELTRYVSAFKKLFPPSIYPEIYDENFDEKITRWLGWQRNGRRNRREL